MIKILAIDHGTTCGYSYFHENKYIESGTIELDSITELRKAQVEFYNLFYLLKPDVVVLEKVNVAGNKFGGDNVIKLAQLQAIIIMIAQTSDCRVLFVNPMSMKKHIAGSGRAEKQDVAKAVAQRFNLNPNHICVPQYFKRKEGVKSYKADESDAIALGAYAIDCLL